MVSITIVQLMKFPSSPALLLALVHLPKATSDRQFVTTPLFLQAEAVCAPHTPVPVLPVRLLQFAFQGCKQAQHQGPLALLKGRTAFIA